MLSTFLSDLSHGARSLRLNPGYGLAVVVTLGLGIGANTAVFSVLNGVLLEPLPYADARRLVVLWTADPARHVTQEGTSYPTFLDWQGLSESFTDLAVTTRGSRVLMTDEDRPESLIGDAVSHNLFDVLGVMPALGRSITADEERAGALVVVISHGLWQRRFGGDHSVLGSTMEVDGSSVRIVGVMPRGFFFPSPDTELWWPASGERNNRYADDYRVVGRLRPGVTVEHARADMTRVGEQLRRVHTDAPRAFAGFGVNVVPMLEQVTGARLQSALWVLFGAAMFVMLIACTNLANLSLARAAARRGELATRTAIGATRTRLARQLATESALLAVAGGALGLMLGSWCVDVLLALAPPAMPRLELVRMSPRVLVFVALLVVIAIVLFAVAPAVQLTRARAAGAMNRSIRQLQTPGLTRVHAALVVLQCAFAVILLAGAGLMLHSLVRLSAVASGFDAEGVTTARISLPHSVEGDPRRAELLVQSLLQRVEAMPGVTVAGFMGDVLHNRNADIGMTVEGAASDAVYRSGSEHVSAHALAALGARLQAGRSFAADEGPTSGVAIVNETFARIILAGRNPIGARIRESVARRDDAWLTVIGVVEDLRRQGLETAAVPEFFVPGTPQTFDLIVRSSTDAGRIAGTLADVVREHDSQLAVTNVATLESRLRDDGAQRRFITFLLFLFAFVALMLAAVGIFGTMHAAITARRREIGIRGALGATPGVVLTLLITHGMRFALVGIVAGVFAAVSLARTVAALLYEVQPADPVSLSFAAGVLLAVAMIACWIPARRLVAQPLSSALHVE